jgi:hypothetical protein
MVVAGTYEAFHTVRSGEKSRPILFHAMSTDLVVVPARMGAGMKPQARTSPDSISVRDTDYIVIEGFTVRDAPRAGICVITARRGGAEHRLRPERHMGNLHGVRA